MPSKIIHSQEQFEVFNSSDKNEKSVAIKLLAKFDIHQNGVLSKSVKVEGLDMIEKVLKESTDINSYASKVNECIVALMSLKELAIQKADIK